MELKRILAKDSRTAMEIANQRYGKDVLVVSSQSVGGQVELVVALDVAPAPVPAAPAGQSSAFTQAFRQALGPMPAAPAAVADKGPLLDTPVMTAAQAFRQAAEPAAAPTFMPAAPAASTPVAAADDAAGRQVVDLVRREIAALRKEFALSRQVQAWQDGRHWPQALAPVMQALQEQGVPAGLRALMIDAAAEVAEAADPREALGAMRGLIGDALSTPPNVRLERGVHAIVGPSGAGKTLMVTRLARAAALRAGVQQVAIIAFNDQRFGAWSHSRVLAAQAGVSCLRAGDAATLRLLLDELAGHALVFIDTAGADCLAQAKLLREMNLGIHLHLLMPADASIGGVRSLLDAGTPGAITWRSLMVGKVDESISPWALLQTLSEGRPPVSYMSDSGNVQAVPRAFEAQRLVGPAFDRLAEEVARIEGQRGAEGGATGTTRAPQAASRIAAFGTEGAL